MEVLFLIGAVQALFLSLMILNKKNKTNSDWILFSWLITCFIHILAFYAESISIKHNFKYPHLLSISSPFPLVHGPLVFLYIKSLTQSARIKVKEYLVHSIPFIITAIYLSFILYFKNGTEKIELVKEFNQSGLPWHAMLFLPFIMLSGPVYILWSLKLIRKHKKNISEQFSYTDKIDLNWIRTILFGLGTTWIVVILVEALSDVFMVMDEYIGGSVIFSFATFLVFFIGYYGIRQTSIFQNEAKESSTIKPKLKEKCGNEDIEKIEESRKYLKSGLNSEDADRYYKLLNSKMNEQKYFLNDKLSLAFLAQEINIHPNYLSQIINQKGQMNFFDFVNSFRIEYFKEKLLDPESNNLTLEALAYDCGFSSKSAFNRTFKKLTGYTPSEYKTTNLRA